MAVERKAFKRVSVMTYKRASGHVHRTYTTFCKRTCFYGAIGGDGLYPFCAGFVLPRGGAFNGPLHMLESCVLRIGVTLGVSGRTDLHAATAAPIPEGSAVHATAAQLALCIVDAPLFATVVVDVRYVNRDCIYINR